MWTNNSQNRTSKIIFFIFKIIEKLKLITSISSPFGESNEKEIVKKNADEKNNPSKIIFILK